MTFRQSFAFLFPSCCILILFLHSSCLGDDGAESRSRRIRPPEVVDFVPSEEGEHGLSFLNPSQITSSSSPSGEEKETTSIESERSRGATPQFSRSRRISTTIDSNFEFGLVVALFVLGLVVTLLKSLSASRRDGN